MMGVGYEGQEFEVIGLDRQGDWQIIGWTNQADGGNLLQLAKDWPKFVAGKVRVVTEFEVWKSIPGYEGLYQVSNFGNVRSVDRQVQCGPGSGSRLIKGKPIPAWEKAGYQFVRLHREGKRVGRHVAMLVLEAFVGPKPSLSHEACHGPDFDRSNNRLDNLRWDTRTRNSEERVGVHNERCESGRFVPASEGEEWLAQLDGTE